MAMMPVAVTCPDAETTGEISGGGWHGRLSQNSTCENTGRHANMDRRVWLIL
jgi:hypothetical protein